MVPSNSVVTKVRTIWVPKPSSAALVSIPTPSSATRTRSLFPSRWVSIRTVPPRPASPTREPVLHRVGDQLREHNGEGTGVRGGNTAELPGPLGDDAGFAGGHDGGHPERAAELGRASCGGRVW